MTEYVGQEVVARTTDEYYGLVGLADNLDDFDKQEVIVENLFNIRAYLVREGFCMIEAGSESSYWSLDDRSFYVRISRAPLKSGLCLGDRTINAYSVEKDGHVEMINQIEGAFMDRKERGTQAVV